MSLGSLRPIGVQQAVTKMNILLYSPTDVSQRITPVGGCTRRS